MSAESEEEFRQQLKELLGVTLKLTGAVSALRRGKDDETQDYLTEALRTQAEILSRISDE